MRLSICVLVMLAGCASYRRRVKTQVEDKRNIKRVPDEAAQTAPFPAFQVQVESGQKPEEPCEHAGSLIERSSSMQGLKSQANSFAAESGDAEEEDEENGDEEDEEEEDEEEPWEMTLFDKVWLQVGWLIEVAILLGLFLLLKTYWPYSKNADAMSDTSQEVYSGPAVVLYKILWGESPISPFVNFLIVFVSLLNFFLFAAETENKFSPDTPTPLMPEVPLKAWVSKTNEWVQILSVIFFTLILVGRLMAAQAHPHFRHYGGNAWWRWLLGSVFVHIEIIALLPSILDMFSAEDYFANLLWLSLARSINWMERQEASGVAVRQLRTVISEEGPLLGTMFIFGTVLWVLMSGMYFLTNQKNSETEWAAAVYDGQKWQRFESIPSSMFFVLLNLCKENPLAEFHVEFWSRICVVTVCLVGTPVFALPTGVLGAVIQNKTQDELEAEESEEQTNALPDDETAPPNWNAQAREVQIPATASESNHPLLQSFEDGLVVPWATAFLSFGSVIAYFYYTAGPTRLLFFFTIFVRPGMMAFIDGIVAMVFAVEWILRLMLAPSREISFLGAVDLLAWLPGLLHFFMYLTGSMTDSPLCMWLMAACVLRVLKCERYCKAFADMLDILFQHQAVLQATLFITGLLWIVFSTLLYYSEKDNPDGDLKENYGSASRALWAEIINLHGEWVWCDYSALGKCICCIIALFSQGLFMIPICIFSDGFQDKVGDLDQLEGNLDVEPWQSEKRPPPGHARRPLYDLLYGHLHLPKACKIAETRKSLALSTMATSAVGTTMGTSTQGSRTGPGRSRMLDVIPKLSIQYKIFRFISMLLVTSVTISTCTLTMEQFKTEICEKDDWCQLADWAWYFVDFGAALFFSIELALRIMAVGLHHPLSFVGFCDILSLLALWASLTPFRRNAFHPTYASEGIWDDMIVPLRLLRLFCLDSYLHPLHTLSRIVWVQRKALLRSWYALVSFLYIFTTLIYLFEFDSDAIKAADAKAEKAEAKGKDPPELIMAQRYRDILSGLQYGLVHLTGDYPITEYNLASRIVHIFGILFGMCTVAAFTGIFVSGFMSFLKSERIVERRQEADRRLNQVLFTVLAVQRQFRRLRQRRVMLQWARNAPEGMPVPVSLTSGQIEARNVERRQAQLRSALRSIVQRSTPEGQRIMLVCNIALIINVVNTLIGTIPEVEASRSVLQVVDFVELFTGYIFVLEYMMHLGSSARVSREILKPMRLIDLFCLIPTFVRMWLVGAAFRWRSIHPRFEHVLEIALVCRVIRVLDFPLVRKTGEKTFRAVVAALSSLVQPAVLALMIWITSASVFMWVEHMYHGPDEENMSAMPETLYWTSIYIIGEWANVDFSPGAGSRMCIFYCLFGVAVFAVPVALMMEAVDTTLNSIHEEQKALKDLLSRRASTNDQ